MQENQRLIKRAQRGDSDAFEELVSPYESRIFAICLRIMGNREDALDCAQDAMLRIFRALGEYRFQAAFTTWLFRITTNVCLDALRRQKVRPVHIAGRDDGRGVFSARPRGFPGGSAGRARKHARRSRGHREASGGHCARRWCCATCRGCRMKKLLKFSI